MRMRGVRCLTPKVDGQDTIQLRHPVRVGVIWRRVRGAVDLRRGGQGGLILSGCVIIDT